MKHRVIFFLVILFAGQVFVVNSIQGHFKAPTLAATNSPDDFSNIKLQYSVESSEMNLTTWHHDCSNITGWLLDTDPIQSRLDTVQDDIDIFSNGSSIYSGPVPVASGPYHGSLWFYELTIPVLVGYGLQIAVELHHPGSPNKMGGVEVAFYDQFGYLTYWVSLTDVWYASSFETDMGYYEDGVYNYHTTTQSGALTTNLEIWHNTTSGLIQGEDNIGVSTVCGNTSYNADREIHSAMIKFWNRDDYDYESNYILDILLKGHSPAVDLPPEEDESIKDRWHHDCSNISGWFLEPNPPQPRLDGIQDNVTILSTGDAILSDNITYSLGRWHGSIFFYELEKPFFLGHALDLRVRMNHPGTLNRMGGMEVGLYDQFFNITCWVSIVDSWYASSFTTDQGYDENGTHYIHSVARSGSLESDFGIWHDDVNDLLYGVDVEGNHSLVLQNQFNPDREVHYVGIMFWNVENYTYESNQVLDILIEGEFAPTSLDITTSTVTETINGTTTTTNPYIGSLSLLIGGASVIIIVGVTLVILRSRSGLKGSPGQYNW